MQLLTLGLNHRTAPVDVRERVSFSREELRSGLMSLGEYDGLSGLVVLSTCNRTELYCIGESAKISPLAAPIAIGLLSSDGGQLGYQKAVGYDMAITETVPLV